jgi:potassium efflux system protein
MGNKSPQPRGLGPLGHTLLLGFCFFTLSLPTLWAQPLQQAPKEASQSLQEPRNQSFPGVAEIVPRAEEMARKAQETKEQLEAKLRTGEFEKAMTEAEARLKDLAARLREMGDPIQWDFQKLQDARTPLESERRALDAQLGSISARLQELEVLRREWEEQLSFWKEWKKSLAAGKEDLPAEVFSKAEQTAKGVVQEISKGASTLLALQERISRIKEENRGLAAPIEATFNRMRGETFRRTEPAFFTRGFLEHLRSSPWPGLQAGLRGALLGIGESLKREEGVILLQIALLLVLGALGSWQKARGEKRGSPELLWGRPWVLAVFLVGIFSSVFLRDTTGPLRVLSRCTFLFSVVILWAAQDKARAARGLLLALAGAVSCLDVLKTIGLPTGWYRLCLALISLLGVFWVASGKYKEQAVSKTLRLGAVVLAVVFLGQAAGYANLSDRLFFAFSWSVILILTGSLLVRMACTGVARAMALPQVRGHQLVERLGSPLQSRICKLMAGLIWVVILVRLFPVWGIYPSAAETWNSLWSLEVGLGEIRISLGLLFLALAALYASLGLSWLLNGLLEARVFTSLEVDPGARHAVGRLIHYFLVLVGLLVALNLVGIRLESFLVLGGALGVGIGFGLQHVANNFISGLILLFERPVKVGDTVVVDKEWGRVKRIGLRSTIIETFDRSELIVPNSHLVSNTVTNWTLSNPMARVRLQVGVAYGTDLGLALKLLREAAENNPRVLRDPPPAVYFSRFGDSAVELELHAWVADVKERLLAQSEIGLEIQRLFGEAGVEIPFPQRDVHIRSCPQGLQKTADSALPK